MAGYTCTLHSRTFLERSYLIFPLEKNFRFGSNPNCIRNPVFNESWNIDLRGRDVLTVTECCVEDGTLSPQVDINHHTPSTTACRSLWQISSELWQENYPPGNNTEFISACNYTEDLSGGANVEFNAYFLILKYFLILEMHFLILKIHFLILKKCPNIKNCISDIRNKFLIWEKIVIFNIRNWGFNIRKWISDIRKLILILEIEILMLEIDFLNIKNWIYNIRNHFLMLRIDFLTLKHY